MLNIFGSVIPAMATWASNVFVSKKSCKKGELVSGTSDGSEICRAL